MLGLVKTKAQKGLELLEVDIPKPEPDEVLIQVKAAGICGSDVHLYEWSSGYEWIEKLLPLIPGHELSGIVVGLGKDVDDIKEGDKVTCLPGTGCGNCDLCEQGLIAICPKNRATGLHRNGAFAEYVAIPAKTCTRINENLSFDIAALSEPLTVSKHAVERAGSMLGNKVAVFGCGTIGLGICCFASMGNARVWVFGKSQDKVKFSKAKILGAEGCINVDEEDVIEASEKITNNMGFDIVFDTTGVSQVVENCFEITKIGGTVVAVGIYSQKVQIDLTSMVRQEKDLITSYGYTKQTWEKVVSMINDSPSLFENFISKKYSLKEGIEAFELAITHSLIKIMLNP